MADSPYIFEANSENFGHLVIEASSERPVLVDFWAEWCAPCRSLMPVLARLAESYRGKFHLVKVNSDEQQELAMHYGVRSLPTVKIFRNGEIIDEFAGALPEASVREYIDRHIVRASDAMRQRARELMEDRDIDGAISLLEQAVATDPEVTENHVELAALHIAAGHIEQAEKILDGLDRVEQQRGDVLQLRKRLQYDHLAEEAAPVTELEQRIAADDNDLQARTELAAHYMTEARYEEAMQQYLEIMKRDRSFGDDCGRKGLLDAFELLGNSHPLVNDYRRKMAVLLY
jgi:putative thioredoxin